MFLLFSGMALAGPLLAWFEDFDSSESGSFSGTDGWYGGYRADAWSTQYTDGVHASTDNDGGTWGSGEAIDNHLVQTSDSYEDLTLYVTVDSYDNDAQGLVFRYADASNTYLFFITGPKASDDVPSSPADGDGTEQSTPGAFLYKVEDGVATTLDSSTATRRDDGTTQVLLLVVSGDELEIWFDVDADEVFEAGENILAATDSTFAEGLFGLYCYNSGGGDTCNFDDIEVYVNDEDNDGIADTDDNCVYAYNPGQDDYDRDGVGDDCDSDADGDGYTDGVDCDDADHEVNPGTPERCETSVDDNCNGDDNDVDAVGCDTWILDADGDDYGSEAGTGLCLCEADGAYTAANATDCDDSEASIHPGAVEVCNELDDDCDGAIDVGAEELATWYWDGDGDGWGGSTAVISCASPGEDWVLSSGDCDEGDASVHPAAEETCNSTDDDCDGVVDEGASGAGTWYLDADGDGYGDAASTTESCSPPAGYSADAEDCDDASATRHPGASEVCNGIDEDCDDQVDEDAVDAVVVYVDADQDGYGDVDSAQSSCDGSGLTQGGDCDDADPSVNPAGVEIDNELDDDCDDRVDEGLDSDGDGLNDDVESEVWGTDPADADSDDDGIPDGNETQDGTDPLDPDDPGARTGQLVGGAGCSTAPVALGGVPFALVLGMLRRRRP